MDLEALSQFIQREIGAFVIPEPRPEALGEPLPVDWYVERLSQMKAALVRPYVVAAKDQDIWKREVDRLDRQVVVVAEDEGRPVMAYDPGHGDGDFVLVGREPDGEIAIWNIRGDAVDCFLSS